MALLNPRPMTEVAIAGPFGAGSLAHKPDSTRINLGTDSQPQWKYTVVAACTKAAGVSLSYGYAQLRGATPCETCWSPS